MKVNENIAMFTKLNNHTYLKQNSYLMNRLNCNVYYCLSFIYCISAYLGLL